VSVSVSVCVCVCLLVGTVNVWMSVWMTGRRGPEHSCCHDCACTHTDSPSCVGVFARSRVWLSRSTHSRSVCAHTRCAAQSSRAAAMGPPSVRVVCSARCVCLWVCASVWVSVCVCPLLVWLACMQTDAAEYVTAAQTAMSTYAHVCVWVCPMCVQTQARHLQTVPRLMRAAGSWKDSTDVCVLAAVSVSAWACLCLGLWLSVCAQAVCARVFVVWVAG
jgi:hypothetical protein